MDKSTYIAKNAMIFFVSNFSSKILVFLLLPLYTSVLSTTDYAISDLMMTAVNLAYIVLTCSIAEAILRYSFDPGADKKQILATGLVFVVGSSLAISLATWLVVTKELLAEFTGYIIYFPFIYFSSSLSQILGAFVRGTQNIKLIGVAGIVSTVVKIALNVILLLVFRWGLHGFLISVITSHVVVSILYIIFGGIYRHVGLVKLDKILLKDMLGYSIPLFLTQICWWVDGASSRYIIAHLLGTSQAGLIAVAYKLPTMLTVFATIFMQAWKLSVIKEFDSEGSQIFFSRMYSMYSTLLLVTGSFLLVVTKPLGLLLFQGEFAYAWNIAPFFIVAFVLNGISSFLGSFFHANRKTSYLFYSTVIGAIANVVFVIFLVPWFGVLSAGLASSLSHFFISLIRMLQIRKMVGIEVYLPRVLLSLILVSILSVVITADLNPGGITVSIVMLSCLVFINMRDVKEIIEKTVVVVKRMATEVISTQARRKSVKERG